MLRMLIKVFIVLVLLSIQFGITYWISSFFQTRYLDIMFFSSIGFIAMAVFFSSSGGLASSYSNRIAAKETFDRKAPKPGGDFSMSLNVVVISAFLFFVSYWILELL
ncbi:hypothetical protein [Evansella tamaricis]|uniref:Uncharacterized protein n=1 Tax=Evansella tamaricis TaxID=2069301 RepID=A0ABS6JEJ5_9BACI|nr:hypothetical protein [Evansella tamaricis]MBU9711933.1 hypothetical protein [Evansella tamaricis]